MSYHSAGECGHSSASWKTPRNYYANILKCDVLIKNANEIGEMSGFAWSHQRDNIEYSVFMLKKHQTNTPLSNNLLEVNHEDIIFSLFSTNNGIPIRLRNVFGANGRGSSFYVLFLPFNSFATTAGVTLRLQPIDKTRFLASLSARSRQFRRIAIIIL